MRNILLFLLIPIFTFSQNIGILTNNPTRTLDVNGNLRVRGVNLIGSNSSLDSIVAMNREGVFKYITSSSVMQQLPIGILPMVSSSVFLGDGTVSNPLGIAGLSANINEALGWTSLGWRPVSQISASNWLFVGNSNTTTTNILGTTNDVAMNIRSNNTNILSFGRRQTLGLLDGSLTGLYPYNQANNSVTYIGGTSGVSSMQFESSSSLSYKPVFFTTTDGNFGFRGSAAGDDWFEVSSNGTGNNGSLNFTIGDDGTEPIVFRKFNDNTNTYVEMMRMQGIGLNNLVRVGVNMNGLIANSTFQVNGSVSKTIQNLTANRTLTISDHSIMLGSTISSITLPAANTCSGRIYILKKATAQNITITSYLNRLSQTVSIIPLGVIQLQSDGTNWQQIN